MESAIVLPLVRSEHKYNMVKLVEWKVREGDMIEKGSTVLVVESDKAIHEIEAEASGFLHRLVEEGQKVMVGTKVGVTAESKD